MVRMKTALRMIVFTTPMLALCACTHTVRMSHPQGTVKVRYWSSDEGIVSCHQPDGTIVYVSYSGGVVESKNVFHPKGHPLYGAIPPLATGEYLNELTAHLPDLLNAVMHNKTVDDHVIQLFFKDYGEDSYSVTPNLDENEYILRLHDALFLEGYVQEPNTTLPILAYWGNTINDGIGDDVVYCGLWQLDKNCYNIPLRIRDNEIITVKSGDIISCSSHQIKIEKIYNDGDGIPNNNTMLLAVQKGNRHRIQKMTAREPVTSDTFIDIVCQNSPPIHDGNEDTSLPLNENKFKKDLLLFANSELNNEQRAEIVKMLLQGIDCANININISGNMYTDSNDIWVLKKGDTDAIAWILAHYDKAGEESQGIHDNACGIVQLIGLIESICQKETTLSYLILFYGGHEAGGYDGSFFMIDKPNLLNKVKYAIEVGGGGLSDAESTYDYEYKRVPGGQFDFLRINEYGGPCYQNHTYKDNINNCDFNRLNNSFQNLYLLISRIEECL